LSGIPDAFRYAGRASLYANILWKELLKYSQEAALKVSIELQVKAERKDQQERSWSYIYKSGLKGLNRL